MKISIEYEITGCKDCPYLKSGRTYGNDGRDGVYVSYCAKGVFGKEKGYGGYQEGRVIIPKVPPYGCPYFKSDCIERVADYLQVEVWKLKNALRDERCELKEI